MSIRQIILVVLCLLSTCLQAKDSIPMVFNQASPLTLSNSIITTSSNSIFSANNSVKNRAFSQDDKFTYIWDLSDLLKINFNVFENSYSQDNISYLNSNQFTPNHQINRSLTGYKIGLSSKLGLGNDYKLGINLDYGVINDFDVVGINKNDINTTSIAFGIRKKKFGASINSDIYLNDDVDFMPGSRLGIEFDWYFSENSKFSFGTKKMLQDNSSDNNSVDSITGNIQYIKFQYNL